MCDTLFNQNYLFKSDKMEKVVLAFSGGLDTTVCVKLLEEEYDYEVITACVDVGQPREELEKSQNSADTINTSKHYIIDARDEFANEYISRGIKANAEYEGYPLSTALARPLIAQKIIEIAEKEGATAIAHGCTGKGNDQFRFEAIIRSMYYHQTSFTVSMKTCGEDPLKETFLKIRKTFLLKIFTNGPNPSRMQRTNLNS